MGVVVLGVAATGCGGGGGDAEGAAAEDGRLPGAVCGLLDRLDEREEALDSPEVFALDEIAMGEALAERREVVSELAEATEGELRTLWEERARTQPAIDEAMLDTWDEDRARLAEEHDDRWIETVVGDDVTDADGEEVIVADHWWYSSVGYDSLVVGCRAPELADGPEQETSEDPLPGRLVFYRPPGNGNGDTDGDGDVDADDDEPGHLVVTDELGENERELEIAEPLGASDDPRDWVPTGMIEPSPAPDHYVLVNMRSGDEYASVEIDLEGTIVEFVQRSREGPIVCPGWDGDRGDRVLLLVDSTHADEREVVLADLTGATPTEPAPLPFATASCSDFVTEDRIVVADAALDFDDDRAVWTVGTDGSDPEELYRPPGDCTTQVGSVDPEATRVALAQSCGDPLDSGVVVVELATGRSQRVVTGMAALPKWSPDGEWLVFGYAPLGDPGLGVWMARPDGRQLRRVVDDPAWFPAWLPPA